MTRQDRPVSAAREAAARVLAELDRVRAGDAAEMLDAQAHRLAMDRRDLRLARALAFAVLRHRSWLDLQYRSFLSQAPSRLSREVRTILRLAAAQTHLLSRIPPHALVNESVELARAVFRVPARDQRFVNAVARCIAAMDETAQPAGHGIAALAVRYSHPEWLVERLADLFPPAQTESAPSPVAALLDANNREAPLTLRANRLKCAREDLAREINALGLLAAESPFAPEAIRVTGDDAVPLLMASPMAADGLFYVQDEASQLVAHAAAPRAGMRVLDLCAAPGGKTTHLAELSGGLADIIATDASDARLGVLRANVARLGTPGIRVLPRADALARAAARPVDLVLADAPCSGIGTLRRHPEIRWHVTSDRIRGLAAHQLEILHDAAPLVRAGGRIVYSTCTVTAEENSQVVDEFLRAHPDFAHDPAPAALETLRRLRHDDGFYRTWPRLPEMDGFEMAVLRHGDAT